MRGIAVFAVLACACHGGDAGAPGPDADRAPRDAAVDDAGTESTAGGSNIGWYHALCDRDPAGRDSSGILADYHLRAKDHPQLGPIDPHQIIEDQFSDMASQGQRRARLLIWHRRGGDDASLVVDSASGALSPQLATNLRDVVISLRDKGFREIQLALGSQAYNLPIPCQWKGDATAASWCTIGDPVEDIWLGTASEWNAANDSYFEENWSFLASVVAQVEDVDGIEIVFDLQNELAPVMTGDESPLDDPTWGRVSLYVLRTWTRFVETYGRERTVGFSIPGTWGPRIRALYWLYDDSGVGRPPWLDVHVYHEHESATADGADAYWMLREADDTLNSLGETTTEIIVGEAYYNDEPTARRLAQAEAETGRPIRWLTQWPLTGTAPYVSESGACSPGLTASCEIGGTPSFCQYAQHGFGDGASP